MERIFAFVGIISCFYIGLVLCQDDPAKLTITPPLFVKPTPSAITDNNQKVNVTIECIGSRPDVSYYIQNRVDISFEDNLGSIHPLTTSFFEAGNEYAKSRFNNQHYTFTHAPRDNREYVFSLNIHGVTHEDEGTYVCVLLDRDDNIKERVETRLTVLNPVESLALEVHYQNHTVAATSTFPIFNEQTPVKLTPGQYMVKCNAAGSNPGPTMSLYYNEQKPYVNMKTDQQEDLGRITYSGQFTMSIDVKAMENEQTLLCTANIPGNHYPTKEAGVKLIVHADKPDIVCDNVTAKTGSRYLHVKCNITTPDGGAGLTCNKVAWINGENNKRMNPGEKYRDDKYDIMEPNCEKAPGGLMTMITMYYLKSDHFETIFYVQYGAGDQSHRVPVQLHLDTTAGSSVVTPLSLIALVVMTTVTRLLL